MLEFAPVPRETAGEFEQTVLLAILHLGSAAYGLSIADEIERRTGRRVARAPRSTWRFAASRTSA
jgi:hypothetical protein